MATSLKLFFLSIIWTCFKSEENNLGPGALAAEYCFNWHTYDTYYCEWGCCGDDYDRSCCAYSNVGVIAGGVIAGLVVITVIVVVVCWYLQQRQRSGRVIGTTTTQTIAVAHNTGQQTVHPQQAGQPYPPGSYGQAQPSGAYGQAYPAGYGQYPTGNIAPPPPAYPPGGQYPSSGPISNPAYPPKY